MYKVNVKSPLKYKFNKFSNCQVYKIKYPHNTNETFKIQNFKTTIEIYSLVLYFTRSSGFQLYFNALNIFRNGLPNGLFDYFNFLFSNKST